MYETFHLKLITCVYNNLNNFVDILMKMPDLGPLIEQGISSVVTTIAPQGTIPSVKKAINIDNVNLETITNDIDKK